MKMHEAILILFLGFSAGYTVNKSAEERVKADYRALTGETIQSLKDKMKACESAKQANCKLVVAVKVGENDT